MRDHKSNIKILYKNCKIILKGLYLDCNIIIRDNKYYCYMTDNMKDLGDIIFYSQVLLINIKCNIIINNEEYKYNGDKFFTIENDNGEMLILSRIIEIYPSKELQYDRVIGNIIFATPTEYIKNFKTNKYNNIIIQKEDDVIFKIEISKKGGRNTLIKDIRHIKTLITLLTGQSCYEDNIILICNNIKYHSIYASNFSSFKGIKIFENNRYDLSNKNLSELADTFLNYFDTLKTNNILESEDFEDIINCCDGFHTRNLVEPIMWYKHIFSKCEKSASLILVTDNIL